MQFCVLMTNCVKLEPGSWQPWQAPGCLVHPSAAPSILARQKYLNTLQQILTVLTEFYRPGDPGYNVGGGEETIRICIINSFTIGCV